MFQDRNNYTILLAYIVPIKVKTHCKMKLGKFTYYCEKQNQSVQKSLSNVLPIQHNSTFVIFSDTPKRPQHPVGAHQYKGWLPNITLILIPIVCLFAQIIQDSFLE